MCVGRQRHTRFVGEVQGQDSEDDAHSTLEDRFAFAFSPRLRCLEIFDEIFQEPTSPFPTVRNGSSRAEAVGTGEAGVVGRMTRWVMP